MSNGLDLDQGKRSVISDPESNLFATVTSRRKKSPLYSKGRDKCCKLSAVAQVVKR